jgi:TIR domain-containing protein
LVTKALRTGFVSYSHTDAALVDRFVEVMRPRCMTQRDVELRLWSDRIIAAGERWRKEIVAALRNADFGLFCVSPSLLASSFIATVELPEFLREERRAIPFALEPLNLDGLDLNGLESLQIFHLRRPGESRQRSFDECRGVNAKRFCDELVGEIVLRLHTAGRVA